MEVYKSSKEDFCSSKPAERVKKLKWWFILLIILGLLALILVWWSQSGKASKAIQQMSFNPFALSVAYADAGGSAAETLEPGTLRVIIMAGVFLILGIVYLAGIYRMLFCGRSSDQDDTADKAADLVKTLTAFFVGAASGLIG